MEAKASKLAYHWALTSRSRDLVEKFRFDEGVREAVEQDAIVKACEYIFDLCEMERTIMSGESTYTEGVEWLENSSVLLNFSTSNLGLCA